MLVSIAILLACTGGPEDSDHGEHDGRQDGGSSDGGSASQVPLEDIDPDDLPQAASPCRAPELVVVIAAHDGDTVTVASSQGEETVRFVGLDTPEVGYGGTQPECWGDEASAFTADLLLGETIWLSFDRECVDPYDRTLAFLHLGLDDDDWVNRRLLRTGQATQLTIDPNVTFEALFAEDEAEARADGAGLWAACGGND